LIPRTITPEPITGARGLVVAPPGYLERARDILDEMGAPFIADGWPLGAFITRSEVADEFEPGDNLSTFGGA
jgi:acetylornithine/succinyldiaminopimelate/putrescine aminotransferase